MGEHRRHLLTCALALAVAASGCRGCTGIDDFSLDDGSSGSAGLGGSPGVSTGSSPSGEGGAGTGGRSSGDGGDDAATSSASSAGGEACVSCYEGPPATEGVGTCEAGERCGDADACAGQTLPTAFDDCVTADREDCIAMPGAACSGAPLAHGVMTEHAQFVFGQRVAIAADAAGRSVGAAVYRNATYFDGSTMDAAGSSVVLWGLDASAAPMWRAQRVASSQTFLVPRAVAMEGDDVVLLVQRTDDGVYALDVERWTWGSTLPASTRTFLHPQPLFSIADAVARADGRTFVAFGHDGSGDTDGDGQPDGEAGSVARAFLAALDDAGQTLWSVAPVSASDVAFHSISVSGVELYVSGLTVEAIDVGCVAPIPADSAFVAVFDTFTGDCQRAAAVAPLGGATELEFSSSLVDASPHGVAVLVPTIDYDVRAFDPDLTPRWSVNVASTFYAGALSHDAFGHVLVAGGETVGKATHALARKLHRDDGAPIWPADVTLATEGYVYFTGGTSLPDGGAMLGGSFIGTVDLRGIPYVSGESASTFYLRLAP